MSLTGSGRRSGDDPVRGLAAACHPLPCLAVTGFAAAWAARTGLPPARVVGLALAVLLGQLSIGWCNDWLDADRDRAAGRSGKPVAAGLVTVAVVRAASMVALLACVGVSLALGFRAGVVHVIAVGSAWAYDLGLKSTLASAVPYAISFGLLPAVATLAAPVGRWPVLGVGIGAGLLGVAAHFANTVADAEADRLTGVRGLPQLLGPRRSLQLTAACLVAAAGALLTATSTAGLLGAGSVGLLLLGGLIAGGVALAGVRLGNWAFRLTLLAVGFVVAGFLVGV